MIKYLPTKLKEIVLQNKALSRRTLLGGCLAAGIGALLWQGSRDEDKVRLYANEVQVLLHTAYHLFPHSKLGPGAVDLHISGYLSYVLADERIMEKKRQRFLKGAGWLEESAYEGYGKSFLNLAKNEKESLLQKVSQEGWGKHFITTVLNYLFEALLSAPLYGSNLDEIGWKWLEHTPGFPQPTTIKEISYAL